MATLSEILNAVACGQASWLGTGMKGCEAFFKRVSSLWITPEGFEYDGTRDLDEEYAQELQAEGKLIVLNRVRTFTANTEDDVLETLDDGTSQVARLGLYQFDAMFIQGLYFQAAVTSLNSFGKFDVALVDVDDNMLGTKSSSGNFKGFSLGMLQGMPFTFATDTTGQKQGVRMQFSDRKELDSNYIYIDHRNLPAGFSPSKLNGVNEVNLEFTATPSDGATTISVKASLRNDGSAFTGIDYQQFNLKVDGSTSNPTAGDDSTTTGTFVLTVAALSTNEDLAISLYDNSNNRAGIEVDNVVYKSNTTTTTVTA